jgi:hypothetical protein
MYKPSTYLLITYFLTEMVTNAKLNINSVEVHPQLSDNRHPVDGALVGPGSLCPIFHVCVNPYHILCPHKLYFEFCVDMVQKPSLAK